MKGHAYLFLLKFTKRLLFHFTIKNGLHQREILSSGLFTEVMPCCTGLITVWGTIILGIRIAYWSSIMHLSSLLYGYNSMPALIGC